MQFLGLFVVALPSMISPIALENEGDGKWMLWFAPICCFVGSLMLLSKMKNKALWVIASLALGFFLTVITFVIAFLVDCSLHPIHGI